MKKQYRKGGLNNKNLFFLTIPEAKSSRWRYWQVWLLLKPHALAYRWPPSCGVLTWSFFCEYTSLCVLRPTCMASFSLNHLLKGPISKYGYALRLWELKLHHVNFVGDHNSAHNKRQLTFHSNPVYPSQVLCHMMLYLVVPCVPCQNSCYRPNGYAPQSSYVETLISNLLVFGDETFGR